MRPGGEVNWLQLRHVPHACDELPTDPKAPCSIDILWVAVPLGALSSPQPSKNYSASFDMVGDVVVSCNVHCQVSRTNLHFSP